MNPFHTSALFVTRSKDLSDDVHVLYMVHV
jgi:hypothetical protein